MTAVKSKKFAPDILGALTGGDKSIQGSQVGKIHIFDYCAYVSVQRDIAKAALKKLENGKIKGRNFRARMIRG